MTFFYENINLGRSNRAESSELLYLWIDKTKYKCFENAEFNFSSQYEFHFSGETLIGKKIKYPNVFGEGCITNISAVVGANGAGKSTLLDFIENLSGESKKTFSFEKGNGYYIAVYKYEGELIVKNFTDKGSIQCLGDLNYRNNVVASSLEEKTNEVFKNTTIVNLSSEDRPTSSFSRRENNSFIPLTPKQIDNNSLVFEKNKTPEGLFTMLSHKKFSLDNFVLADYLSSSSDISDFPIFSNITFNTMWDLLRDEYKRNQFDNLLEDGIQNVKIKDSVREYGKSFAVIPSLIRELSLLGIKVNVDEVLEPSIDSGKRFDLIIQSILASVKNNKADAGIKNYVQNAIREIKLFHKLEKCFDYGGDLSNRKEDDTLVYKIDVKKLKPLISQILSNKESFIFKYLNFNFYESQGEITKIRFEAYLYYLANRSKYLPQSRSPVLNHNLLLLLDEIDVHLHPEWQRLLVSRLVSLVRKFFNENNVQIIITTHSPIVLSDIPGNNIMYISFDKTGERTIERRNVNTFGANIHELYNDSFFFENKIAIGEYAKNYIDRLYKVISEGAIDKDTARCAVGIIGEKVLKNRLYEALDIRDCDEVKSQSKNVDSEIISSIKQQIKQLESLLIRIEGKK